MAAEKSLMQRELEDFSSDDGDCLIMSAAAIVDTYSNKKERYGGSVSGHRIIYRDTEVGHQKMFQDYLADDPTYGAQPFTYEHRGSTQSLPGTEEADDLDVLAMAKPKRPRILAGVRYKNMDTYGQRKGKERGAHD